jgi:EAL domain-containing protein (putative c-di-GMP-specific phosphodiesterase class I)
LTPLLDSARMRRAVEVAASLSRTGHKGSVFVATTAESLNSDQFLDAFADAYQERQELAGKLVLFFSQSDVAAFSAAQWGALNKLRVLGFRFGLEDVNDFSFEFTGLSATGFAFLKLGADVFRKGLPTASGPVPANNICRYLGGLGLTVIVDDIDRQAKHATALDFAVPLGQGPLFGGPQAIAPQRRQAGGSNAAA